ncbi:MULTISPECIES: hypothetical protein [unclassified Colwellia]|uniref:hypothetical protein n=1 Tax=unclassified Colwellia TaxID=196834 RepID=UPI0015F3B7AD|nr:MULTISPECIES: hypothetical protein [unclassified Colwellia]MBA6350413.1 hypothetical protein [Colwellia sp. BRX8-9]MBA6379703.1 hypothetical protein [Colwellia sp. BRX10-7]MBA6389049.1 hypothetical protein [Colwellia sp. BRX10-2]MBA6402780.1 hypothetical protein [Colwellia sp. BRX10-5]MBA6406321.1 hypothetical protein [Colwellia sp. BRX10-1]
MNIKIKASSLALLIGLNTGCMSTTPQQQMSAEERAQIVEMQKAMIGKMFGGATSSAQQKQTVKEMTPIVTISEKELLAQKLEVDTTGGPALFARHKDGILINNEMFNDFEGSVASFGGNRITGQFTYAVKNFDGTFTLKYNKANSENGPIKIATVEKKGKSFNVTTVTGKSLPGSSLTPTSDGFIVGRAGSAFKYTIGKNQVKSITILDNYHIADHQNGDVASTNYILLEKNPTSKKDSFGSMFDSISSIGNSLGLNKADHYILVNINNGTIVPLDVSLSGKTVAVHSNCTSKGLYNDCKNVSYKDALYNKQGLKNSSHYFWAIDWIDTKSGPLAFYKTSTTLKVVDIKNSKVHTLFSRTLGINDFLLIEHVDGKVSIEAQLGFSKDKIEDVEQYILKNTVDIEEMQTVSTE